MRKFVYCIFFLMPFFLMSCSFYKLEKKLDPEHKDFLSTVRYIITQQERKIFFNLPPSERGEFIEQFWKKRDPDPYTDINEFKDQYFARIEEANNLFRDGGQQGWLQDRGRVYILLGPPERRDVYPRGYTFYGKPVEIWYYGFFPIVFIDNTWNGNYELEPLSAQHIAELNKAQMGRKPKVEPEKVVFDFNLSVKKVSDVDLLIQVEVPYRNIWFREEDNKLRTVLGIAIEIFDSSERKVWETHKDFPIELLADEIDKIIGKGFIIEIPLTLDRGNFSLTAELQNKTSESRVRKKVKFDV